MSRPKDPGGPRRLFRLPFREGAMRDEVDDEIRFHLEERAARLEREGMSPEDAQREAERRFGDVERISSEVERTMKKRERTERHADTFDDIRRDVAFAGRQIVTRPGFSAIAIFTIAIAIAATTSIFSVVDGIMLRPLPFDEPDELVMVWMDFTRRDVVLPDKRREWLSWPNFADFRDEVGAVESISAFQDWRPTLTGTGSGAEQLTGGTFSLGMFSRVLGVEPALGRGFLPEEDRPDGPRVVLLSDGFWRRAFAADPSVLDRTIRLNDVPYRVVGVMPPDFRPPEFLGTDVWTTLQFDRSNGGDRRSIFLRSVGRLGDDATLQLAQAQASQLATRLADEYPDSNVDTGFNVYPLHFDMVQQASTALWILLGAVSFVLLIACVNVANLLLARGASRSGELAVRVALGAGARRIASQFMTESLLLGLIGGAVGAGLAVLGTAMLVRLAPDGTPLIDQVAVDGRILGFAAFVTVVTSVLFGVLPATRAARIDPAGAMRESGRSGGTSASTRLRSGLVVGQVALALVLLVGAGLLVRSFQNLRRVDLGFDPTNVISMRVQLPQTRYPDADARRAFFGELEERLGSLAGVEAVGSIGNLPLAGFDNDVSFQVEGAPPPVPGRESTVWFRRVTPGYFESVRLEIVSGRAFSAADDFDANRVVIVNETLARAFFGGQAVGKRLNVNGPEEPIWREVVGVARDIKNFGVRAESRNALYLPYAQAPTGFMFTTVRAGVEPASLIGAIRAEAAQLDSDIALASLEPLEDLVSSSLATDRFTTSLLGGFALIALLLAAVGLYGVVSYGVSMRLREMGVRMALGAPRAVVRRLVLRWALSLALAGIVIGAVAALSAARLMKGLLFGVGAADAVTFTVVALVMAGTAALASILPAIRATRVDPIHVLKAE